ELFQPILHRLAEVIAATAERRSAFLDKVALLSAPAPRDGCRIPRWRPAALVSVDPVQPLQPLAHRLLQVVVRPAESGIAARDEFLLLAPQGARLARSHRFTGRPGIRPVHLQVEVGEFGIGANRFFHLAPGGGAIETRLARDRLQRAPPPPCITPRP